jgi:hypothetical protein
MNRSLLCFCFSVVLTQSHVNLGWSQAAVSNPTTPGTKSLAQGSVKVPIRIYWGYMVIVEGSAGNLEKLNFLVDTGAYPSVIDQKIADHLGLTGHPARVNVSNQTVEARLVVLDRFMLSLFPFSARTSHSCKRLLAARWMELWVSMYLGKAALALTTDTKRCFSVRSRT